MSLDKLPYYYDLTYFSEEENTKNMEVDPGPMWTGINDFIKALTFLLETYSFYTEEIQYYGMIYYVAMVKKQKKKL